MKAIEEQGEPLAESSSLIKNMIMIMKNIAHHF